MHHPQICPILCSCEANLVANNIKQINNPLGVVSRKEWFNVLLEAMKMALSS
jgi:hypothetical protein